jgi:hypothetical protein
MKAHIQPHLERMLALNAATGTQLRGGAFCTSVERDVDGLPWVQAKSGVVNLFYPPVTEPLETLRHSGVTLPPQSRCAAWEPEEFATLEFEALGSDALARLIEDLFVHFYGFDADTPVVVETFDVRG